MRPSRVEGLRRLAGLFVLLSGFESLTFGWFAGVELAVGSPDRDCSVWSDGEGPSAFVNVVVVPRADRCHVGEVGFAVVFPWGDVVDFAFLEGCVAAVEGAGSVDCP